MDIKKWDDLDLTLKGVPAEVELESDILADIFMKIDALGLRQSEIAKVTGLKKSTISRLFKGQNDPTLITLCKLIEPFGYTLKMVKAEIPEGDEKTEKKWLVNWSIAGIETVFAKDEIEANDKVYEMARNRNKLMKMAHDNLHTFETGTIEGGDTP